MSDASETIQYFPNTLGSYWVYEDQDGNELTRRVIEDKEIDWGDVPRLQL